MKIIKIRSWAALKLAVTGLFVGAGFCNAAVIMTFSESGSDVLLVGSGNLNTTSLVFDGPWFPTTGGGVQASRAILFTGTHAFGSIPDLWIGFIGPSSFGSGISYIAAQNGTGDRFGINGDDGELYLPEGYISGTPLTASSIYTGASIASLGLTIGTYVYSWGPKDNTETLTINVIPEPSTALLGTLGLLALLRRRR